MNIWETSHPFKHSTIVYNYLQKRPIKDQKKQINSTREMQPLLADHAAGSQVVGFSHSPHSPNSQSWPWLQLASTGEKLVETGGLWNAVAAGQGHIFAGRIVHLATWKVVMWSPQEATPAGEGNKR